MKSYKIKDTSLVVSRISYGCAVLGGWDKGNLSTDIIRRAERLVHTAYETGITLFDHADFYGRGNGELVFGEVLKRTPSLRESMVIQSKCGQLMPGDPVDGTPYRVDLSRDHIVKSVEGSLKRLCTDHLDILLLHAPDALMVPEEIGEAFEQLKKCGKVRYFGVSNYTAAQIARLQRNLNERLIINQIQLGLDHSHPIVDGMEFPIEVGQELPEMFRGTGKSQFTNAYSSPSGAGTFDYCCLHDIQIQAWSPLRGSLLSPSSITAPRMKKAAELLADIAMQRGVTSAAVMLAWLLRHPAGIVPVIGTLNPEHLVESCQADNVVLSREEWYVLFTLAAHLEYRGNE